MWAILPLRKKDFLRRNDIDLKCWQRRYCAFPQIAFWIYFWTKVEFILVIQNIIVFTCYMSMFRWHHCCRPLNKDQWKQSQRFMFQHVTLWRMRDFLWDQLVQQLNCPTPSPAAHLFCDGWLTENVHNCVFCFCTMNDVINICCALNIFAEKIIILSALQVRANKGQWKYISWIQWWRKSHWHTILFSWRLR